VNETPIAVEWQPNNPEGHENCESKIRSLLRFYAAPTDYDGGPVRVQIGRNDGGWYCVAVRSGDATCPLGFMMTVDLALRMCGLQVSMETSEPAPSMAE